MAQTVHAAREGDAILHPSLAAEMISAIAEAVIYAAATAAVAAAISLAVVGTAATGGVAGIAIAAVAGVAVGAMSTLSVGEDQTIGGAISSFCDDLGNSVDAPDPYGKIESGSANVFINSKPAARAAGITGPPGGGAAEGEQAEPSILENVGSMAMAAAPYLFPVLGLGMAIRDIFNPPVTTPKDPDAKPRDEDTTSCSRHPPLPDNFIAQGSDNVFINGQPAARSGDKTTCDATIDVNEKVSPNVRIGGGTATVRDIRNGKSKIAMFTGIIAGILISRRIKFRPRPLKSMFPFSLFKRCVGNPVIVSTGSKVLRGPEDVDFSLPGLLGIEWARGYDSNDIRRDGLFGMGWSVPYEAELVRVPHPQGGQLWIYIDEEGNRLELGSLSAGDAFVSVTDGLAFFQLEGGQTVVEDINEGRYQIFDTDPFNPQRSRLTRIGDRNLNVIDLMYDDQGRLQVLYDKYGRTIVQLHYDLRHPNRVNKVSQAFPKNSEPLVIERNETLVSYRYTEDGQLHEVLDATGQLIRRFTYNAEGYLNSHQLASGAVRHYEWEKFSIPTKRPTPKRTDGTPYSLPPLLEPQPDHEWRVVRHWGSDGEEYRFEYNLEDGETFVTDSLGRQSRYHWGPMYEVYKYIDPLGNCWQEEIVAGQLVKSIDPQGGEWRYSYDDLGRLIETRDPLGRSEQIEYLRHWALPVQVSDGAGRTQRYGYDAHGNLLWEQDSLGRSTQYQYNPEGRVTRIVDALEKTKHLAWNTRGQLLCYRDCCNAETLYHYDSHGRLRESINARGEHTLFRYDARGYLIESERPDGRIDRYEVDAAGQLTRYIDPAQKKLQFRYDCSGRMIERVDAMGYRVKFSYDAYGRLLQLTNENEESYRFGWDNLDRLIAQEDLDGSGRIYEYDVLDGVTSLTHVPSPHEQAPLSDNAPATRTASIRHDFKRDAVGRLLSKRTEDGVTVYSYDTADNLIAITFTDNQGEKQQLNYTFNANGQLLSETNSAGLLQYHYDELGNLQTLVLPDQRELNYLYYGSGHLHQINLNGGVISDFERDAVHDEVLRTQGKLVTRTRYDSCGRLAGKAIHYRDAPIEALPLLDKSYSYDPSDNLIAEVLTQTQRTGVVSATNDENAHLEQIIGRFLDLPHTSKSYSGRNQYGYDLNEQLQTVQQSRPSWQTTQVEDFKYDKAGNLFDGPKLNGLIKHNRVLVYQDKRYRYDRFGRLCEKRIGSNWVQYFEYDAEHRLICVEQYRSSEHERVVFTYDPLGRRISKEIHQKDYPEPRRRVHFHWQGLRLLQEVESGLASLYVYDTPDSYEPLARIDGKPGNETFQYFHSNLAGLPEQLTDSSGNATWQTDYQGWGKKHDEWACKQQAREQNLRYQGQYIDRETGLHYNTSRYYDPDIGRFTQNDTIGISGGINLTAYSPNAFTYADPLGLAVEQIPYGDGLSQSVINQRIIEGNFNAAKTNYAAIKYSLNGKEHIEVMRNTPGGLHSEEKLLAKYANRSGVTINEIYSERRPCPGCNSLVNRHSPKNTFSFQYSTSGRSALQSALSNIKKTIC
ncbi:MULTISPECIES: RHS repeat-associated core domain-containing protein [Pseudomonas]|jgi:RHS repeat-associated protein|uniref:Type IV secretion protein Rhs n=1 Tax=Pseudomonas mosselii TaxID=78327 RepID=A0A5R8YNN5_9PSED|nr:RHS repeat-associated core domain-containing protein [Pseudomonas mosselii]TLP55079.1 type IV secretion protein Rhs [Pseudomonas mosselii]